MLYKFARFTLIEWHVRQEGASEPLNKSSILQRRFADGLFRGSPVGIKAPPCVDSESLGMLFVSDDQYNAPQFWNTQAGFAFPYRFSHWRSRKSES